MRSSLTAAALVIGTLFVTGCSTRNPVSPGSATAAVQGSPASSLTAGNLVPLAKVNGAFAYHVGDALIQSLGFPPGNQARAENGDVVTVIGTGTFDAGAKSATGGGTFVHKTSGGTVVGSGTWAATGLLTFQSYGNAVPQGLPPTFFGGRVALKVLLTPAANPSVHLPAILQIECALGKPLPSTVEGVRLNVQDLINFNKTVPESGANVYIQL